MQCKQIGEYSRMIASNQRTNCSTQLFLWDYSAYEVCDWAVKTQRLSVSDEAMKS